MEAGMHRVVIAEPYRFVPPHRGEWWPRLLSRWVLPGFLRRTWGVARIELAGVERLAASIAAGHGVMLAPNHCRPCDPLLMFELGRAVGRPLYTVASWHLFKQAAVQTWLLRRIGAFSIYREGLDRDALRCAIEALAEARRPLVLFPEGVVTRSNDRLRHLMDGTAFIARNAARQRAAAGGGQVVVHPVAIRYRLDGDVAALTAPVLAGIERRLSWRPRPDLPLAERIARLGFALLALKELEHLGAPQPGTAAERLARLIDALLVPHEAEWLKGRREADVVGRVKALRTAILPDLVAGELSEAETARRWRQLEDLYLAQQLSCYPPDYLAESPTPERLLETVERFEEDLTDEATAYPLSATVTVGEAIPVSANRERGADGDPLMAAVRGQLAAMLGIP
jgi:1-acyl-sn-glycerol-3-phosphate acyltransferase